MLVEGATEYITVTPLKDNRHATQEVIEGAVGTCIFAFLAKHFEKFNSLVSKSTIRVSDKGEEAVVGSSIAVDLRVLTLCDSR